MADADPPSCCLSNRQYKNAIFSYTRRTHKETQHRVSNLIAIDYFSGSHKSETDVYLDCAKKGLLEGNVSRGTDRRFLNSDAADVYPPPPSSSPSFYPPPPTVSSLQLYFLTNEELFMIDRQSGRQPMTFIFPSSCVNEDRLSFCLHCQYFNRIIRGKIPQASDSTE